MVAIVILAGGYLVWTSMQSSDGPTPTDTAAATSTTVSTPTGQPATDETPGSSGGEAVPLAAAVSYDGANFSPRIVTIKRGGTVTWTRTGSGSMWVASDEHPTHTEYAGTSRREHCPDANNTAFDQCVSGSTYSFTFTKAGTWDYHDHVNASAIGSIVVVE